MTNMPVLASMKQCTGCGACFNACTRNVIRMIPDAEGFLYPDVQTDLCKGCGACDKSCPVLNPHYPNYTNPRCYAMMASDEERTQSASGAFIPVVANWVLSQGGIVYGAAWKKTGRYTT